MAVGCYQLDEATALFNGDEHEVHIRLAEHDGKIGGRDRKTSKMMRLDLAAARKVWIDEAETALDRKKREASDFLAYCNHAGLYADFHALRHSFITNLERAGVRPKVAQTLARHSDVRLTLGVYTHVELEDKTAAISALPGPPKPDGEQPLRIVG